MSIARHHLFTIALALIGAIAPAIAGVRVMEGRDWRAAMRWLRDAEALVRRVLFAQAVGLAGAMRIARRTTRVAIAPPPPVWTGARRTSPFRIALGAPRRARAAPPRFTRAHPPTFRTAPLEARIDAVRAVCADPLPYARRLARRIARRRADLPMMLRRIARHRPHAALRETLDPVFREPPEIFIAETLRPATGADPPSHLTLVAERIPPFRTEQEKPPLVLRAEPAVRAREAACAWPDCGYPECLCQEGVDDDEAGARAAPLSCECAGAADVAALGRRQPFVGGSPA